MGYSNYGVNEINPIPEGYLNRVTYAIKRSIGWDSKELKSVIRLRLLSDPGYPVWDVSYCHGVTKSGEYVDVTLPFSQLPKRQFRKAIVKYAIRDGVYARGIHILENISTLI